MRVTIDLVSFIRQANLATDGTRKCVVSGSLKEKESQPRNRDEHAEPAEGSCGVASFTPTLISPMLFNHHNLPFSNPCGEQLPFSDVVSIFGSSPIITRLRLRRLRYTRSFACIARHIKSGAKG
jgi:hypothetical protein